MGRFAALFGRPSALRRFHGYMTILWFVAIPLSVFTSLRTSVEWLVLMSAWANFVGHFSSWQAARVEVAQDKEIRRQKKSEGE